MLACARRRAHGAGHERPGGCIVGRDNAGRLNVDGDAIGRRAGPLHDRGMQTKNRHRTAMDANERLSLAAFLAILIITNAVFLISVLPYA